MTTLAMAANTMIPAYLCLITKGYEVTMVRRGSDSDSEEWSAANGFVSLIANDPVALLGLVTLYEHRGESWRASDSEIAEFLQRFGYEH